MKSVIIVLCCLGLSLGDGFCQGKVLIVSRDTSDCFEQGWPQRFENFPLLESALGRFYKQEVTLHFGLLPDSLEQYEAIFTDLRFFQSDDSLLVATELEKLAAFLMVRGKLYIEVGSGTPRLTFGNSYSEFPLFDELTGSVRYGQTAAQVTGITGISGVPGTFTEGITLVRKNAQPTDDHGGLLVIRGDGLSPVLETNKATIGWQHDTSGRKVVFHWPIVREHYVEFIGRVVCNYFGLCEPLQDVALSEQATDFSVRFDALSHSIIMTGLRQYSLLELYSTLGVRLLERSVDIEDASFSAGLPSGNYIVVARSAEKVVARPIVVWK